MNEDRHEPGSTPPPTRLGSLYRTVIARHFGLDEVKGARALDIGGWDGYWASRLEVPAVVIDLQPSPAHRGVSYVSGDALSLPFASQSFDAVFGFDVIEHVPDERSLVLEAVRVLRPGGQLVLTTPDSETRIRPGFLQSWVDRRWGHDRVRGFSPRYVEELMQETGLADVHVRPLSVAAFRRRYLFLSVLWRTWPAVARRAVAATAERDASGPEGPHGWIIASGVRST